MEQSSPHTPKKSQLCFIFRVLLLLRVNLYEISHCQSIISFAISKQIPQKVNHFPINYMANYISYRKIMLRRLAVRIVGMLAILILLFVCCCSIFEYLLVVVIITCFEASFCHLNNETANAFLGSHTRERAVVHCNN